MQQFEVSERECQLIEILREWKGSNDTAYRLEILHSGGAYEIELSMPDKNKVARGVGATLDEAWDSVAPSWA